MSGTGNYLTRLAGEDQRQNIRRPTNAPGTIFYMRRGVRGYASQLCRMTNISENGCLVCGFLPSQVPEFLYLVLDGLDAKFACAVVARSDTGLHLRFMIDLPTAVVKRIARHKFSPDNPANDS